MTIESERIVSKTCMQAWFQLRYMLGFMWDSGWFKWESGTHGTLVLVGLVYGVNWDKHGSFCKKCLIKETAKM